MTKEELVKLALGSYNRGVKDGILLTFDSIRKLEAELVKFAERQACDHEFYTQYMLCSDPPKKQCKKCSHTEII